MRYNKIRWEDISNGPGFRVSIFTQGCKHHCPGCFNEEAFDPNGGKEWTKETNDKIIELLDHPYIQGLSILGGEPLLTIIDDEFIDNNIEDNLLYQLVKRVKTELPDKDIYLWTGYRYDEFHGTEKSCTKMIELERYLDYVIDGRFMEDKADPTLSLAGSTNQNVYRIDSSSGYPKWLIVTPWR